ncbi:MAG: hypothetical protein AB7F35_09280 [Acetobacteraceae bacterium]
MSTINLPLTEAYHPAGFVERGVTVPFTTPQLEGARIRPAQRTGTEFIIPNLSGGRGVYILDWGGVRQLCTPTVHDTLLHRRIAHLPSMTPGAVRQAARELAAEGMAGRDAATAARTAIEREQNEQVLASFLLLMMLVEQLEPTGLPISAAMARTPALQTRADLIVSRFAPDIGVDSNAIADALEAIGRTYAPVGLDSWGWTPRLPALLDRMRRLHTRLVEGEQAGDADTRGATRASLAASTDTYIRCGEILLREARAPLSDVVALLRTWHHSPATIHTAIKRPDWVLDGWDRICVLAELDLAAVQQPDSIAELARMVPSLPREALDWVRTGLSPQALEPAQRGRGVNDAWRRGGASFGLIARNEQLRARMV